MERFEENIDDRSAARTQCTRHNDRGRISANVDNRIRRPGKRTDKVKMYREVSTDSAAHKCRSYVLVYYMKIKIAETARDRDAPNCTFLPFLSPKLYIEFLG